MLFSSVEKTCLKMVQTPSIISLWGLGKLVTNISITYVMGMLQRSAAKGVKTGIVHVWVAGKTV